MHLIPKYGMVVINLQKHTMIYSKKLFPFIAPCALVGTLLGLAYPFALYMLPLGIIAAFLLGLLKQEEGIIILAPIAFACAISLYFAYAYGNHLAWYNNYAAQTITMQGTITDVRDTNDPRFAQKIVVHATHINNAPCSKKFLLHTSQQSALPGDRIVAKNLRVRTPRNEEYRLYLFKEGIQASFFPKKGTLEIESCNAFSFARIVHCTQSKLIAHYKSIMPKKVYNWFASLFLGSKDVELSKERAIFQLWGISHFLARSGMHLVIFLMLLSYILRLLPLPYLAKKIILIALCCLYILLSYSSISMYRAFFTLIAYTILHIGDRQIHALHALMVVTVLILAYNPAQAFFLDFQLSFGITFLLVWHNALAYTRRINSSSRFHTRRSNS